ncbi:hypothetical protein FQR65_LT14966 [Abscondita terminalis]|nr:hypothetical protein FQR65_LT14966 [Abscondita terminalis]
MLLPPNATKQEQALVEAIDYKVDPSCVKGFKFSPGEKVLPWIIEEYGLGEILHWVKDKRKAVVEGVKFQDGTKLSYEQEKHHLKIDVVDKITLKGFYAGNFLGHSRSSTKMGKKIQARKGKNHRGERRKGQYFIRCIKMEQPNIIEPLNFEEIFSRMKEELVSRDESFTALVESDPAIKILEVAAWRELLLRERINEAARSNLLKFARGEELDNLAEFYGVERENGEKDERFRKRIKAKIVGWSTGGNYRYYALSADTRVKDALVESPVPGKVQVSILSTELSTLPEELLEIVRNQLNREDVRILTDTIEVVSCNIIEIVIHSKISIKRPDIIETVKKQFIEKFETTKRLGWK